MLARTIAVLSMIVAAASAISCTVNSNANYRAGPSSTAPPLGMAQSGARFNALRNQVDWLGGDLLGGRPGVWIHVANLVCAPA
ncbi:hypothetical protein BGZ95_007145, partial [Linnemannia exigua]